MRISRWQDVSEVRAGLAADAAATHTPRLSEFQTLQTRVKELEQRMDTYERSGPPLALPPPGGAVSANAALQAAQQAGQAPRREGADDDAVMMLEE